MADKPKTIDVDLTQFDNGKAHWLSPHRRWPHIAKATAEKYLRLHKAQRAMERATRAADRAGKAVKDRAK